MSRTNFSRLFLAAALLSTAVGVAQAREKKFACPLPDKRACISVIDAYKATHNGGKIGPDGKAIVEEQVVYAPQQIVVAKPVEQVGGTPVQTPQRCCAPVRTAVTVRGETLAVASPVVPVAAMVPAAAPRQDIVVRTTREEPFRVPAQVMRIFISPWEDEQGDLHMGGYMFSEIAPRKWSVGNRSTASSEGYRLLTLTHPPRDAAQDETTGKSVATAQAGRAE